MKYTTKAAEKSTVKITIKFDGQEWKDALMKAYQQNKHKFAVNGFRKGKAPKNVIESVYGKGVFYDDALNAMFSESYAKIIEKESYCIDPEKSPKLAIAKLGNDAGIIGAAYLYKLK